MENAKITRLEKNQVEAEFTIGKEEFAAACVNSFKKNAKRYNVPGFRRGKATKNMIEQYYGKGVFWEDALNEVLPAALEKIIADEELRVVSRPDYDIEKIDENGVEAKAKFYVYPEIELDEYKGMTADRTVRVVTDEEVDHEIGHVQQRNAREVEITDRPAAMGDTVVIDYEGFVDGVAFEGGKGNNHALKLGSGQFIPGFEEAIVGHNIDETFDVNVTFPEEYHAEELKGKPAVFKTTIHAIKFDELPELDDEFAKDVSEFETFAEYKADVKAKLEKRAEEAADAEVDNKLSEALIEKVKGDIPEAMIETEIDNQIRDYSSRLEMQGLRLEDFMAYTGQTIDKLREDFRPRAEKQIKLRLALEKIVEIEKLDATEEEIADEIKRIANAYGMEAEKVKEIVSDEAIGSDVKVGKAAKFIRDNAVITEKAPEEEKPKKKPAAKKTAAKKATAEKAEDEEAPKAKKPAAKKTTAKKPAAKKDDENAEPKPKKAPAKKKKTADAE